MSKWMWVVGWSALACLGGCSSDSGSSGDGSSPDGQAPDGGALVDAIGSDASATLDTAPALDGPADSVSPADAGADQATSGPITAAKNVWTWVDVPGSSCDEGTPTGLAVNPGDGAGLVVYHEGGGACWDFTTCILLNAAAHGPFRSTEFARVSAGLSAGTIFDRSQPGNPFRDYSFVYVPYCTGDLHGGDNVITYGTGGLARVYHHTGRRNVTLDLARISATFPQASPLVVAGSSAGGFGAVLDYDLYRAAFPLAKSYLLDDSGPLLEGDAIPPTFRSAFYTAWGLDKWLTAQCANCPTDMSALMRTRIAAYPQDRMALISSLQDQTIRTYFMLSPDAFQTALLAMAHDVFDPSAKARYFFVSGETHTTLGNPAMFMSKAVTLPSWISSFVGDDPAWASTAP